MLVVSGLGLWLAALAGWPMAFIFIAGCLLIPLLATWIIPESSAEKPATLRAAVIEPFAELWQRFGKRLLLLAAFVMGFSFGDAVLNAQAAVFLVESGYSKEAIAGVKSAMGMAATIAGTAMGGLLLPWLGVRRGLLVFGGLQAASNLAYAYLAVSIDPTQPSTTALAAVVGLENFCGGLAKAPLIAWLMALTNPRLSATQYALLTACMAASRDLFVAPLGYSIATIGWAWFFIGSGVVALPFLALLPWVSRRSDEIPR